MKGLLLVSLLFVILLLVGCDKCKPVEKFGTCKPDFYLKDIDIRADDQKGVVGIPSFWLYDDFYQLRGNVSKSLLEWHTNVTQTKEFLLFKKVIREGKCLDGSAPHMTFIYSLDNPCIPYLDYYKEFIIGCKEIHRYLAVVMLLSDYEIKFAVKSIESDPCE